MSFPFILVLGNDFIFLFGFPGWFINILIISHYKTFLQGIVFFKKLLELILFL